MHAREGVGVNVAFDVALAFGVAPIFELVTGVARQFSACISMNHVVDVLM